MTNLQFSRRRFLQSAGVTGLAAASGLSLPAYVKAASRPVFTHGVQSGDVDMTSGMVWTRTDRPSRIMMEYATTESFSNAVRLPWVNAMPDSDLAAKRLIDGLPSDQDIFYRFVAADLQDINNVSEPIVGRFRTAPSSRRNVRFVWSGDTAGQGWGIDETGMKTYATMAKHQPDFFLHSGDTIYADGPMKDEVDFKDGTKWKNVVLVDEKRKVAETLDEYRAQWKYNMLDRNVRELSAVCPTFYQWDDHEVLNNWSDSKDLSKDDRYKEKSIQLLSARAARAFHEMSPIRYMPSEPGRVYRKIAYGPLVDVFFLDMRTYRGPNHDALETELSPKSRILGEQQVAWLKRELANSKATWKVIAADMPIGLHVNDGKDAEGRDKWEAIANGDDGPPRGRELEIARLLSEIKKARLHNIVWLTADVHYTAAHFFDPAKAAKHTDFLPFWEFVSGPLHAGGFGPNKADGTFGMQVVYQKGPGYANAPPSSGLQFFGQVDIDAKTQAMTVTLKDLEGSALYTKTLSPALSRKRERE